MPTSGKKSTLQKKLLGALMCICLVAPVFAGLALPKRAEAIVFDPTNLIQNTATSISTGATAFSSASLMTKEYALDAIAWVVVKVMISQILRSTTTWIQNGFHGNPAFVQDPRQFFFNVGDIVAGDFILNNPDLNFLCSPFGFDVRASVLANFQQPFRDSVQCTLSNVVADISGFTNDLRQGDWVAWDVMTSQRQNNPYGAFFAVQNEMNRQIRLETASQQMNLDWGRGFLTWQDEDGNVMTPGSVIESQLNQQLGSGVRQLELADEFNEVVVSLVAQFVSNVVGGGSGGLRGAVGPSEDSVRSDLQENQNAETPSSQPQPPPPPPPQSGQTAGPPSEPTYVDETCDNPALGCDGGAYILTNGAVWTGGTYTGGTCVTDNTVMRCTGGSYSGGACVSGAC